MTPKVFSNQFDWTINSFTRPNNWVFSNFAAQRDRSINWIMNNLTAFMKIFLRDLNRNHLISSTCIVIYIYLLFWIKIFSEISLEMGIGWGMSSDCEDESSRQISLLSNQVEEHRREKSRWNSIESESWKDMYSFLKLGGRSQLSSNPCHPCLHAAHHCHHFPLRLLHRVQVGVSWFGQSASI